MSRMSSWVSKYFDLMAKHSVWSEFPQYAQEIYEGAEVPAGEGESSSAVEAAGSDALVNSAETLSGAGNSSTS